MKITLYKSSGRYGYRSAIIIDCKGDGTKENPIIIEPLSSIPKSFIINGYKYHIVVKEFKSSYILAEQCQNISIEDTELNRLRMERCSNITISNITCLSRLTLYRCKNIVIKKSFITRLRLFKSSVNTIKNNFIIRLKEIDSKNNQLTLNEINKVQASKSFNYWATEYNTRCACLFMILFGITISSIPILLMGNLIVKIVMGSIVFSILGGGMGIAIIMLFNLVVIRPILNKYNKKLIENEKIRLGIVTHHPVKEKIKVKNKYKESIKKRDIPVQSPKVRSAYQGRFEIDDEIIKEFGIQGKGTQKDPYIIDSTEHFPQRIEIYKSKYFMKIINCDLTSNSLGLYFSQNILIENCELHYCEVGSSSDIRFTNCSFKDGLKIIRSKEITSENCLISIIGLFTCYNNHFLKCEIDDFEIKVSRGNTFENCKLPPELLNEERLNPPIKKDMKITSMNIVILFSFVFVFIALGIAMGFFFSLIVILIMGGIIFIVLFPLRHTLKKAKSLETGKFDHEYLIGLPPNVVI